MNWSPRLLWLLLGDKKEMGLTAAQVSAVTAIDPVTIQNWSNRGLVKPFPVKGKGDPRVFGSETMAFLTLTKALLEMGYAPRPAFVAAEMTWHGYLRVIAPQLKVLTSKRQALGEKEFVRSKAALYTRPDAAMAVEILSDNQLPDQDIILLFRFGPILLNMASRALAMLEGDEKRFTDEQLEPFQFEILLDQAAKRKYLSKRRAAP